MREIAPRQTSLSGGVCLTGFIAGDPAVVEAALASIASLFMDVGFQPPLSTAPTEVLMLGLSAIRVHRNEEGLVFAGVAMLANLAWSDVNRRTIVAAGAVFDVADVMGRFQVVYLIRAVFPSEIEVSCRLLRTWSQQHTCGCSTTH